MNQKSGLGILDSKVGYIREWIQNRDMCKPVFDEFHVIHFINTTQKHYCGVESLGHCMKIKH
jgi:hypothetical protein